MGVVRDTFGRFVRLMINCSLCPFGQLESRAVSDLMYNLYWPLNSCCNTISFDIDASHIRGILTRQYKWRVHCSLNKSEE